MSTSDNNLTTTDTQEQQQEHPQMPPPPNDDWNDDSDCTDSDDESFEDDDDKDPDYVPSDFDDDVEMDEAEEADEDDDDEENEEGECENEEDDDNEEEDYQQPAVLFIMGGSGRGMGAGSSALSAAVAKRAWTGARSQASKKRRVEGGPSNKSGPFQNPELDDYTEEERKYYQTLSPDEKRQVDLLEKRMLEINEFGFDGTNIPRRFRLLRSDLDEKRKAIVFQKLHYLDRMPRNESEYTKLTTWMDGISKIPFGRYKQLPVNSASPKEEICKMLRQTKEHLDTRVYGHHEVKDHIIRILAQWISNPSGKGIVIGIHGAPGVGKTVLVKDGICNCLNLPFSFIPLGGMADRSEFIGHSYTYEGARWGRIVSELMSAGHMNPVFFFDELDKISGTKHGEEIVNLLMQITDPSQNDKFHDSYYSDFEFDLSRCIIIFSYNDESMVNPILRDRMIRIETKGYKLQDKLCICKEHLIPEMLKEFNMPLNHIEFTDDIMRYMVDSVEEEQGVRNLKRALHDVISNLHLNILIGDLPNAQIQVTKEHVTKYVHKKKQSDNVSMNMIYL